MGRTTGVIAAFGLSAATLGCVTEPDSLPKLTPDAPLVLESDDQLVTATIELAESSPEGESVFLVSVDPSQARLVAAEAWMPAHSHGTDPVRIAEEGADFRVENVLLFMPGRWEISLLFALSTAEDSLAFEFDVRE